MAWKQDLAKLKQQLPPEPTPAPVKPPPRPVPLPGGPPRLDDEDAVFLSAMGLKPARAPRPTLSTAPEPATPGTQPPQPPPETFEAALKELKGLKPLAQAIPGLASYPAAPLPLPTPPEVALPKAPPLPVEAPPAPEAPLETAAPLPAPQTPTRFQLAAGMAIEVDGSLDLRGHSLVDATERIKDRLGDGHFLGWRSLQVILGTDPMLHEGLLVLLSSGELPMVSRYAQAPIPMGGAQAWLLYLTPPSTPPPPGA